MKTYITITLTAMLLILISNHSSGQNISLLGSWQLVKQTNCMDEHLKPGADSLNNLLSEMKSKSSASPYVVKFKDKSAGEESMRMLFKRRSANSNNFLYKLNANMLLILDKKSQTISDTYTIDKLSADSLVLTNSNRACETKIFLKIKDKK